MALNKIDGANQARDNVLQRTHAGTVAGEHITTHSVTAGDIASGAIGADAIGAGAVGAVALVPHTQFIIVASGVASLVFPASPTGQQYYTMTIPHGLSYIPSFQGYIYGGPFGILEYLQLPWTPIVLSVGSTSYPLPVGTWEITADATNVHIYARGLASAFAGTWFIKYYLFQETAN